MRKFFCILQYFFVIYIFNYRFQVKRYCTNQCIPVSFIFLFSFFRLGDFDFSYGLTCSMFTVSAYALGCVMFFFPLEFSISFSLSLSFFSVFKIILHAIIAIRSWKIARQRTLCYKQGTYYIHSRFSRLNNASRANRINQASENQRRGTTWYYRWKKMNEKKMFYAF